ncbi:MAG: class I SAM-dependent methyltransferase [Candidatus Hydrogenedentes bacterium]|nr:class I SAM-dependent methyltransferase [Candidatus Hydrogenedentota bacterium]
MAGESSKVSSGGKRSLALDPNIRARLGDTRYRLIKLWVQDVNGPFEAALAPHVSNPTVLLDAGCSRGDPDIPSIQRARQAVGCDVDLAGLRGNTLERDRVLAGLEALPFADESFDVVVCKWVVEHLSAPRRIFREFWRVLRPGGVVAILTPNRFSMFALVARLVPYRLKQAFKAYLFGGHEEDTHPTLYRANTIRALRRTMTAAAFVEERIAPLPGIWAFFIFLKPLALAVRAMEYVQLHTPGLRLMSTHIMGVWRK